MGTKHRCAAALLLAVFLLFCTACGAAPVQPEDTENKDQYMTDPVPEGKPAPVEPQDVVRDDDAELTCTFSISCATILDNWDKCDDSKKPLVPADGVILPSTTVSAVCEFFTNDETEGIKCILTEWHTGSESNGYAPAESSLKNSLLKR